MITLSTVVVNIRAASQSSAPKLFVDPPKYTASVLDEVFTIDINVANVTDLGVFEFKLGYNTTLLDGMEATVGSFPPNPIPNVLEINEIEGYIWIGFMCSGADGNGTLATITFKTKYAWSVSCPLHLYDTLLGDNYGNPIDHTVEDGYYEFVILNITVATDKSIYQQGDKVEIHGNLTLESSPYQGLVAVEVDDPDNYGVVRRTLQTGVLIPPGNITIVDVVPCGGYPAFLPRENFTRGVHAYFNVTVRNNGTEWENVAVSVNVYDGNIVSLGAPTLVTIIGPGTYTGFFIADIYIPDWANLGVGTVYVSAFTGLPRDYGVPYCPEKSNTFNIVDGTLGAAALEAQALDKNPTSITTLAENDGSYNLTFTLLTPNPKRGNYTVYATSGYLRQRVMDNLTFEVAIFGDVDGNGVLNILDVKKSKLAYSNIILPPDPVWYRVAALAPPDDVVNILDVKKVKMAYSGIL